MTSADEIPISTLTDAHGLIELGLVAGDAFHEVGIPIFDHTPDVIAEVMEQVRGRCLSLMRNQAQALGGAVIAGASISVTITSIPNGKIIVAVHGSGTAAKRTDA